MPPTFPCFSEPQLRLQARTRSTSQVVVDAVACSLDTDEILKAARKDHGLERLDQIKYAVLEAGGGISIIPRAEEAG